MKKRQKHYKYPYVIKFTNMEDNWSPFEWCRTNIGFGVAGRGWAHDHVVDYSRCPYETHTIYCFENEKDALRFKLSVKL